MQTATLALQKLKIRQSVRKFLEGNTLAGKNIFGARGTKFDTTELPCIMVYPTSERVRRLDEAPKRYARNFACRIEVIGSETTPDKLEEQLEIIAEQASTLIEANQCNEKTLGPLVNDLNLTGSQYSFESEAQNCIGSLILDYDFEVLDFAMPEGIDLAAFLGVDTKWKLPTDSTSPPDDGLVKANDKIELPQT